MVVSLILPNSILSGTFVAVTYLMLPGTSWKTGFISKNRIASVTWSPLQEVSTTAVNTLSFQECKAELMRQREQFHSIITNVLWRLSQRCWQDGCVT